MNKEILLKSLKFGISSGLTLFILHNVIEVVYINLSNPIIFGQPIGYSGFGFYLEFWLAPYLIYFSSTTVLLTLISQSCPLGKFTFGIICFLVFLIIEYLIFQHGMRVLIGEYQEYWGYLIFISVEIPWILSLIWFIFAVQYIYKNYRVQSE